MFVLVGISILIALMAILMTLSAALFFCFCVHVIHARFSILFVVWCSLWYKFEKVKWKCTLGDSLLQICSAHCFCKPSGSFCYWVFFFNMIFSCFLNWQWVPLVLGRAGFELSLFELEISSVWTNLNQAWLK